MHRLGCAQFFIPVYRAGRAFVATREYFPRKFKAAVRQKTRFITGIALQSWQRHGWRDTADQLYWFWRDRKGLVGNLAAPLANVLFLYGALTWLWAAHTHVPWVSRRSPGPVHCDTRFSPPWDCRRSTW